MTRVIYFVLGVAVAVLYAAPFVADAQNASGTSAPTIASLLAQVAQLQAEIQGAGQTAAQVSTPVAQASSGGICPVLNRTLSVGSMGADVANLQAFLAAQGDFHSGITAYFGTLTQVAVEEWQAAHGIVSSGSPASTGFGKVGPRTAATIMRSCSAGSNAGGNASSVPPVTQQSLACPTVSPPAIECSTAWQPITDANGCTTSYQCSIPLPGMTVSSSSVPSQVPTSCPFIPKPVCSGTLQTFGSGKNGCPTGYECILN